MDHVSWILEAKRSLDQVLILRGWTAEYCLRRVADRHKALGYGSLGARKDKVSRWTSPATHRLRSSARLAWTLFSGPTETFSTDPARRHCQL